VTAKALRSVEKSGGFDSFMANSKACKMSDKAKSIRKEIMKVRGLAA
jgi:ribosomal protein L28